MRRILLIVSHTILALFVVVFAIAYTVGAHQRATLNAELSSVEAQNQKVQQQITQLKQSNEAYTISQSSSLKNFVTDVFSTLYNYDNSTYVKRFTELKGKVADNVITELEGGGAYQPQAPQQPVQNKVDKLHVYIADLNGKTASALVSVYSTFSVGGADLPENAQLFELHLTHPGSHWMIDNVTALGKFAPEN